MLKTNCILIRAVTRQDVEQLQAIRTEAFGPVFASFRAILGPEIATIALANAEREQSQLLDRMCAEAQVFVAEREGELIGFVTVILDDAQQIGELGLNAVLPSESGAGVGSALYEHALGIMKQAGMRVAYVGAGGDTSHSAALRTYAKAGFSVGISSINLYRTL